MKTEQEIKEKLKILEYGKLFVKEEDKDSVEKAINLLLWVLD